MTKSAWQGSGLPLPARHPSQNDVRAPAENAPLAPRSLIT